MADEQPARPFHFVPIGASTLRTRIASEIRSAILKGHLKPGSRVVESRLAKEICVAQSSVREAIHELERQGLLVKHVNRETRVRLFTADDLTKLFRIRMHLEGLAVELAHPNFDESSSLSLYRLVEQMRQAGRQGDIPEFYRLDIEFHSELWALAQNEFLFRSLEPLSMGPMAFILAGSPLPVGKDYVVVADDHAHLLESLRSETAQAAKQLMLCKLEHWLQLQMEHMSTARPEGVEHVQSKGIGQDFAEALRGQSPTTSGPR